MCLYVMLYSAVRFGLEMLRGDYVEPFLFGLKSAQATSLCFFLIALGFFLYFGWREKHTEAAPQITNKKRSKKIKMHILKRGRHIAGLFCLIE